jgi:hypothetical protein
MKIVQALYWLHDVLPQEHDRVSQKILYILQTKDVDGKIRDDLNKGLDTLPMWMRKFIDGILKASGSCPA